MQDIPVVSIVILYILLGLFGIYFVLLWGWQLMVFRGKRLKNVDGSYDDWHEQKMDYGFAFSDLVLGCPIGILGVVLAFFQFQFGFYIMSMVSFWFLWVNLGTTVTSLKFQNSKLNFSWFMTFPFGAIMSLAFIVWSMVYYDVVYNSWIFVSIGS